MYEVDRAWWVGKDTLDLTGVKQYKRDRIA